MEMRVKETHLGMPKYPKPLVSALKVQVVCILPGSRCPSNLQPCSKHAGADLEVGSCLLGK